MAEIIKEGVLFKVKFNCKVCGCEFNEDVDLCDNTIGENGVAYKSQCPCCNTWVNVTKE